MAGNVVASSSYCVFFDVSSGDALQGMASAIRFNWLQLAPTDGVVIQPLIIH
jgi:hypothetical protein